MFMYVWLILGFVLLMKGADLFVEGSSSVARLLKIPSVIIGLTIVAFGTSMPEASVSVTAALAGRNELSLSNVIGSNLFNLLVVAGGSAMIRPVSVDKAVLKKDFPFSILVTVLVLLMCIPTAYKGGSIAILTQPEGFILLALFLFYLCWTVRHALKARHQAMEAKPSDDMPKPLPPFRTAISIAVGLLGIIWGGDLVVESATSIAAAFGLSETLIGLTIVALGTSLPELVTSLVAARKGESDIALGNVIGSNLFNLLLVLGASCAVHPAAVNLLSIYDIIILIAASVITYFFALHRNSLSRKEGAIMLPMYAAFFIFIILR